MKRVLIISVGTTTEPILKSIKDNLKEGDVIPFFIYGRPFPNQSPNPFEVTQQATEEIRKLGIEPRIKEVSKPEDIDDCLAVSREILREADKETPEEIVVDITGGTKPMSAALCHATLSELLGAKISIHYTGGAIRNNQGRTVREAMEVKKAPETKNFETQSQILSLLKDCHYKPALFLVSLLPSSGRWSFLKNAVEALDKWDEFHYEEARRVLFKIGSQAEVLQDDKELGDLAKQLIELRDSVQPILLLVNNLKALEQKHLDLKDVRENVKNNGKLLISDILENVRRRLEEGRAIEAIMRAYRSVEAATQLFLISQGLSPWHPDWSVLSSEKRQEYLRKVNLGGLPSTISLFQALNLIEILKEKTFSEDFWKKIKTLQELRNHCFIEHGYLHREQSQAQEAFNIALELTEEIFSAP